MMKLDRFTRSTEKMPGGSRRFQSARCGGCLDVDRVNDNGATWLPPEAVAKKFERKGWLIGKRAIDDRCPRCVAKAPAPKVCEGEDEMVQKMATPATAARPAPTPVAKYCEMHSRTCSIPAACSVKCQAEADRDRVKAEPPREPSQDDRRRVRALFEELYDEEACRWRTTWSDASAADRLNVPRAWVTQYRETGGYGPDQNEAADAKLEALRGLSHNGEDLHAKAMAMAEQCLKLAGEVETFMNDVRTALGK